MKATDLNQALNFVADEYLAEADTPEKETLTMKNRKKTLRILIAAALISLLSLTAYAADALHIHTLESGSTKSYKTYSDMGKAIAKTGLDVQIPEQFQNGFRFQRVTVQEVKGRDENEKKVLTFLELDVYYENSLGQQLILCAYPNWEEIQATESLPSARRTIEEIELNYYLDHYQFVPEDYELSEEEKAWEQQPGHYISRGSKAVENHDVAFLCWENGDVSYFFMDRNAAVSADTLFSMAGEMIQP